MHATAALVAFACIASRAAAQTPLISQRWPWPYNGPEKVDTSDGPRGIMTGYNRCNATTEGPSSLCVNAVVNNASDFCVYGLPTLDIIANGEGETVAYCTNKGYGTRIIPGGTITGLQVVKTPGYLAIAGFIDQTQLDIMAGDTGGELDPHGADQRGNPIGSLMYSTAFGGNGTNTFTQVIQWHEFIGSGVFCLKACDPAVTPGSAGSPNGNFCENTHDTIGCTGNVPLNYNAINGTFSYCQGDNQEVPNGNILPIPATSNCVTYASTQLFAAAASTSSALPSSSSAASSASMSSLPSSMSRPASSASMSTGVSSSSAKGAAVSTMSLSFESPLLSSLLIAGVAAVGAAAVLL